MPQQRPGPTAPNRSAIQSLLDLLHENIPLAIIALFAFGFIFQNFMIPSGSMASTLLVGDHVVADRTAFSQPTKWAPFLPYRDVRHNDIVVFWKPTEEANGEHMTLVKRVIGLPGDRLHLTNGVVYLNGQPLPDIHAEKPPYANVNPYRDNFPAIATTDDPNITAQWSVELPTHVENGDLVVPPGYYFVMGDNRAISLDSRYWGFVPRGNILGQPLFVYWSFPTPENLQDAPASEQASFALHQFIYFFDKYPLATNLPPHRISRAQSRGKRRALALGAPLKTSDGSSERTSFPNRNFVIPTLSTTKGKNLRFGNVPTATTPGAPFKPPLA